MCVCTTLHPWRTIIFIFGPKRWHLILYTCIYLHVAPNSELIWCDLILLKKSPKSGRVKIKIAKVTTNTTTRLHTMMDIYGLFWGSTGLKYINPPFISRLGKGKFTLVKNPKLRDSNGPEVKAMVGWIKWPQFERHKYLLHTCKTRRV